MNEVSILDLNKNDNVSGKAIEINGKEITVLSYLPIQNKLNLIEQIVTNTLDDNNFINYARFEVYFIIDLIFAYSNISVPEDMNDKPDEIYDIIVRNNIDKIIMDEILVDDIKFIRDNSLNALNGIYAYKNSALGIMRGIADSYDETKFDSEKIKENLSDTSGLQLVKDVVEKLG